MSKPEATEKNAGTTTENAEETKSIKPRQRPRMALTRNLKRPTEYVHMMNGEFGEWALNEERALKFKGKWRPELFQAATEAVMDLEIGTGNGYHFAHLAEAFPDRCVLGIEIKFKPLIQSIRRAVRTGATNARILRYDAKRLDDLFQPGELNNIYIHFPDPWTRKRQWKHRLIQKEFLETAHGLMRPGSYIDFKTDSADYYQWSIELFRNSPFKLVRETENLHGSEWKGENFVTHFEDLFMKQGLSIHYARLVKEDSSHL